MSPTIFNPRPDEDEIKVSKPENEPDDEKPEVR